LNHITLKVSHLERSRHFYQEMFGLPVSKQTDDGYNLGLEDSFLGIYETESAGLDHVCIGIAAFQFDLVMEKLNQGPPFLKPTCRGQRIFLHDPDGIRIQLSSVDYRGFVSERVQDDRSGLRLDPSFGEFAGMTKNRSSYVMKV